MDFLREMGYLDFLKNEKLLGKHFGNLQAVANELAVEVEQNN